MTTKKIPPSKRKYDPKQDLRRFLDGVRMHPFVATALEFGVLHFCPAGRPLRFDKRVFVRTGLHHLASNELVARIDPAIDVPDWVTPEFSKLARRGGKLPIWLPTAKMSGYDPMRMWDAIRLLKCDETEIVLEGNFTSERKGKREKLGTSRTVH